MPTLTLTTKGQLTLPKPLRDALGLAAGSRLQASVDRHGRIVLVPWKYEPESLFVGRPSVRRTLTIAEMDDAIARG